MSQCTSNALRARSAHLLWFGEDPFAGFARDRAVCAYPVHHHLRLAGKQAFAELTTLAVPACTVIPPPPAPAVLAISSVGIITHPILHLNIIALPILRLSTKKAAPAD